MGAFARSNGKRPRLVHRLDAQTSGVIVAARTQPAAAALSAAFAGRDMHKTYLALVSGPPLEAREGTMVQALIRYRPKPQLELMREARPWEPGAQEAATHWRALGSGEGVQLLELRPSTGRMHQLRVHLSLAGRPILGDPWYGGAVTWANAPVDRLMLHALRLAGPHPAGGSFDLTAPPPQEFTDLAARAGLDLASLPRKG
jgi:23S rRNA-/tRNA-specific pseudouridylate synthase